MARPIDEKIVAMKMDNSDFKRKAVETSSLFGKLTQALNRIPGVNLGKITNDLSGIQKAANGVSMDGLGRSIDSIAGRFSNLGVIATTALVNISNKAVDAGLQLANSLGPAQIADGFREYEMKMGSIGTIMANTEWEGATLKDVNKTIAELNDYADETIYNFAEMTASIGKFTTAGVKLEDSAIAIKGMGNLAAISGSNTQQMNTAMYQMSQMMAAGKMNLMDWNSLVNAGMAGKKTQDALLETAKAMGKNVDMSEGFRNSISDGWLTAEVFLETMKKFGEDEAMTEAATKVRTFSQMMDTLKEGIGSGWAESFEIIVGDFEEATKLWTGVSEFLGGIFEKQTDTRNKILRAIFDGDGLKNVLTGLKNIVTPIGQLLGAIGDGFRKAFPPMNTKGIKNVVTSFAEFTEKLKLSESSVKNLETVFSGFFSIFAIGWKIVKGAVAIIIGLIPSFEGLGAKILELIAKVAKIPIAFNNANDSSDTFGKAMEVLKTIASGVATFLEAIVGGLIIFADTVGHVYNILAKGDFTGGPWEEDSKIIDKLFDIREAVVEFGNAMQEVWSIFSKGDFTGVGPWEEDSKIVDFLFDIREGLIAFGSAIMGIEFSMKPFASAFESFVGALKSGYEWIAGVFSTIGEKIKSAMPSGNDLMAGGFIAGLVGIVGLAIKMAWDFYQVFNGWGQIGQGVAETLEGVGSALESFGWQVKAQALLTAAFAVGVLAASFWAMSKLDGNQIANGLYAIIGGMTALVGALAIMTKYDITGTGMKAVIQIVALAVAFRILSGALRNLSDMKWGEITKGLVGLGGTMLVFSKSVQMMSKFGANVTASAGQMIAIALSMLILVQVLKQIADMKPGELVQGMIGLTVLLGVFAGAVLLMSKFGKGNVGASALQFVAIAGSILIMVEAIRQIAEIDVENLKVGLATIGYILAAIALFTVITKGGGLMATGAGLVLLASALNLMLIPIATLGNMSLETLAVGIGAMAVALLAIAGASYLMTGMIPAGIGLMMVAAALHAFIIPITVLGNLPIPVLATGIIALAGAILLIGGAATLLGLAGPALLLGAAGIAALGIALLAAGAGVSLFATGLVTLAAMTGTAVTTIVAFLGTLIVGLASLIPKAVDFVWQLIQHMAQAFRDNAPTLAQTMYDGIIGILNVISENIPKFVEAGTKIITNFLDALAENVPKIVQSAAEMMVAFIESLAAAVEQNGPQFIDAWMRLMAEVTVLMVEAGVAVVQALFGWIPGVTEATTEIGETAEATIREAFGATEAGQDKGKDFASGLSSKSGDAKKAGNQVGDNAESGADSANLKTIGSGHGGDFASGLASKASSAKTSGTSLATSGKSGAGSLSLNSTGINFGQGFASGINSNSVLSSVVTAGKNLASRAKNAIADWLGIASPSRVMRVDGGWFGKGFALGIADKAKEVGEKAKGLAVTAKDSLNQFLDGFQLPEENNEIRFKAVVDYEALDTRRFGRLAPIAVQPDTSTTRGLVSATKSNFSQNGYKVPEGNVDKSTTNNNKYDIHVSANGTMSKSAVRKLAEDIQEEIKNLNDRARISRGEEVAF